MKKKYIIFAIVLVVFAAAASVVFITTRGSGNGSAAGNSAAGGITLFYGNGCSHCEKVFAFLKENKIEEKVKFETRESFQNEENSKLLEVAARQCGIPADQIVGRICCCGDVCARFF